MPPPRPWRSRIGGALRRLAAAIERRPAERALERAAIGGGWLGTATEHGRALAADGAPEAWLARLREAGIVPPEAQSGTEPEAADAEAPPATAPRTPEPTDAGPPAPSIAAARDERPPSIAAAPLRRWPADAPVARLRLPAPRAARSSSLEERSRDARAMEPGTRPTERQPRRADPVERPADALPPSRAPAPEPSRQREADDGLRPPRARGSGVGGVAAVARGAREERGIREERGARRAEPRPGRPLQGERVPDPGAPFAVAPAAPPAVPHAQPPVDAVPISERTPLTRPGPPAAADRATVAPLRTARGAVGWPVPAPAALVPTHPIVSETARASSRAVAHPWPDLGAQAVEAAAATTPADIARELVRVVRLEQEQSAV